MINKNKILVALGIINVFIIISFQNKDVAIGAGIITLLLFLIEKTKSTIYIWLIVAILGSIVEASCIHFGIWHYTHPNFIGIPMWLPIVWGNAGIFISRISKNLS